MNKEEIIKIIDEIPKARGEGIMAVANHKLTNEGVESYKKELEIRYIEVDELKKEINNLFGQIASDQSSKDVCEICGYDAKERAHQDPKVSGYHKFKPKAKAGDYIKIGEALCIVVYKGDLGIENCNGDLVVVLLKFANGVDWMEMAIALQDSFEEGDYKIIPKEEALRWLAK